MWISEKTNHTAFELDEIFHFIKRRERTETKENTYVMTMISREPRQILAFAVEHKRTQQTIQNMVDSIAPAKQYYTDGYSLYSSIYYEGHLNQNSTKENTHGVESINADLRHHIPGLRRRSRIFYRTLDTFRAVLSVFVNAYNKFGEAKFNGNYKFRQPPFSVLDFL